MGYFRFFLAIIVCMNHLIHFGVGRYAVYSFYMLSGFLISSVLTTSYGFSSSGLLRFYANRFLRVYPVYIIVLTMTLLALFILGTNEVGKVDVNTNIPDTITSWVKNITLMGLDFNEPLRVVAPAWSLFIEVSFYCLIPFLVFLGRRAVSLWLLLSVLYHVFLLVASHDSSFGWNQRYGTLAAGSLGFSIGCWLFMYKDMLRVSNRVAAWCAVACAALYIGAAAYSKVNGYSEWVISIAGFYLSMMISAPIIVNAFNEKPAGLNKLIGNLSFPLYLVHIPVGFVVFKTTGLVPVSFSFFIVTMVISIMFSISILKVDGGINKIRDMIRP